VEHLARLTLDGTPHEDPVELAQNHVRLHAPVPEHAAKTILFEAGDQPRAGKKGVEVARDYYRSLRRVALGIGENLFELVEPELLRSFAFQMQIVNHQKLAAVVELGHQRHAPALAPLEYRQIGIEQPVRLPPSGLMLEADHARSADRHGSEQRLAVIRRIVGGSLAQLFKFGGEDVVHAESLGQILGDVFPMGAPGVEIHLLQDAQIRFMLADLFFNFVQVLAAVDVPI
jgi:hypothetical protein